MSKRSQQEYIRTQGHAPTSVLTRHYAQISDEMLRAAILPAVTKW